MTVQDKKIEEITGKISFYDKAHLKMISLIHDRLFGAFIDPYRLLRAAGLREGEIVLEVGPGPGFFTIPAAEIIGDRGRLYSLDINPASIAKISQKIRERDLRNAEAKFADAANTGLARASIDVAFLFGVIHSLKDLDRVLVELDRVLKPTGILAVQKSSWSEKKLLTSITGNGLFRFAGKESRVYRFEKARAMGKKE